MTTENTSRGLRYTVLQDQTIGSGAFSHVLTAKDCDTGEIVALKTARVPSRINRPNLQHEVRVIRSLGTHPAVPVIFGYGRFPHFEYIAMEYLGYPLDLVIEEDKAVQPYTVRRLAIQLIRGLEHIHRHGIVHRDVKPSNILCVSEDNPAAVKIIDYGLAKPFSLDPSTEGDSERGCIGTVTWASLNAHDGIDLGPKDDLQSLAYTLLFLIRGSLPWDPPSERLSEPVTRKMKEDCSGTFLGAYLPYEFGQFLDESWSLDPSQLPDYDVLLAPFSRDGADTDDSPLDWTPCEPKVITTMDVPIVPPAKKAPSEPYVRYPQNSYSGYDLSRWTIHHSERLQDLTFNVEGFDIDIEELDKSIPRIVEMTTAEYGTSYPKTSESKS